MKKIININLNGRVIPIEDAAYEKLQQYIESLRRYFANEEGRDEIINDIESRISELMNEKIRKGADAVTENDVDEIVASMGRVEDFEAAEEESADTSHTTHEQNNYYRQQKSKRLYRDANDKFIGGVCSGIAAYLNIDATIVRILFAIITFGGFGFGFFAYIVLWIVLPPKDLDTAPGKRLYRNPDDKILGGVAGGIAAYFDKSASTIRLIFAAPIILSALFSMLHIFSWHSGGGFYWNVGFGSFTSTFIITYIILWIVLPEANSDYQKMEMRGETVDINRIRQNVREGMGNVKERMKSWGNEVKESAENLGNKAKEFTNTKGRAFASDVNDTMRRSGSGIGHLFRVIFNVFLLFILGSVAFTLFVAIISLIFSGIIWSPVNNYLWTSQTQQVLAWSTLVFFLIVPLVAFIVWLVRRITKTRSKSNYLGWTFGGLWALGWVCAIVFVATIVKDFRYLEHTDNPVEILQPKNDKLIVTVTQPGIVYSGGFNWFNRDGRKGYDITNDSAKIGAIKFKIKLSPDLLYHVSVQKYSFGKTNAEAIARAEKIGFSVMQKDSLLDIANSFTVDKNSKYRGQHVEVEILVPAGKQILFDPSVNKKLNVIYASMKVARNKNGWVKDVEISDDEDEDDLHYFHSGVAYTMSADGRLVSKEDNSRKELPELDDKQKEIIQKVQDSLNLIKSIEQKKKELKELEEKQNMLR